VIDLGTGDGRAVMARARRDPRTLVIGIDASAAAMAESSRRAARPERKGGLPNALFLAAAAEALPEELRGRADELTILFPWGSLLRASLATAGAAAGADGIAALLAPAGRLTALISVDARDGLDLPAICAADAPDLAARWAAHGLALCCFQPAAETEIKATGSSWARRLGAGRARAVWRLELRRDRLPAPARIR
jgi:16S rRNA (adenine(1408)-N(1))-methyltransferase